MGSGYQVAAIAILLLASGVSCAPMTRVTEMESAESLVDARLREAGEAITRDLAVLAGSTQHRDKNIQDHEGNLQLRMDLVWHGPIEGALERVAARIGYKFGVSGNPPVTPLLVRVKMLDRPALLILREIGLQTGKTEGLEVDETLRSISLTYGLEAEK